MLKGLGNLILANNFSFKQFIFFTWLQKRAKCDPNGVKKASFSENNKTGHRLGASPPDPHGLRQLEALPTAVSGLCHT